MDVTQKLLAELVEEQKTANRLRKFSIVLQAEALAVARFAAEGGGSTKALDTLVVRVVKSMRKTVERVAAGKGLLA
jgi:hypothetical protein